MTIKIALVDVCLPDYFGGHHLPVLQVPVDGATTRRQIANMLHSELNIGVINYQLDESNIDHEDVRKAIDECLFFDDQRKPDDVIFPDLDVYSEDSFDESVYDSVYAFFVVVSED